MIFTMSAVLFEAGAQPLNNIFDRDEKLVWLGLDFTAARFVGDLRGWGSELHTHHIVNSLNNLMIKESRKFDMADALNRRRIDNEIETTIDHNRQLNLENAIDERLHGHFLDHHDIQQVVNTYDFKGLTGTGVIFIVEAFNKPAMEAAVWVTFVDLETKQILFSRKMIEEPVGFGVRNFWAGSIYKIMKQIKKREYGVWRRAYARES